MADSPSYSTILILNKCGAMLAMGLVAILGGLVPFYVGYNGKKSKDRKIMPLLIFFLNAFAGGALLGLGFFHLLPEADEQLRKAKLYIGSTHVSAAYVLVFCGYAVLLFLEHVLVNAHESPVSNCNNCLEKNENPPMSPSNNHSHSPCSSCDPTLDCLSCVEAHNSFKDIDSFYELRGIAPATKCLGIESHSIVQITGKEKNGLAVLLNVLNILTPPFFLCLGLAVHSIFEGMVVGSCMTQRQVWLTTAVILGHKGPVGVAIGTALCRSNESRRRFIAFLSIFIIASPVGVAFGMLVSTVGSKTAVGVVNSIATGTVFYISQEIIEAEFCSQGSVIKRVCRYVVFLVGAFVVFGLSLLHVH